MKRNLGGLLAAFLLSVVLWVVVYFAVLAMIR